MFGVTEKRTLRRVFLVKFVDGFSSPPHIHNVTYRGVVLSGLVHNDDPKAEPMWMPRGTYWTQPAGEVHITSAKGQENIAYIEIAEGPYLVMPTDQAFDRGERPVNVDPSNLVWLDGSNTTWIESEKSNGVEISFLWGKMKRDGLNGSFLKLPAGFSGQLTGNMRVVIVDGLLNHHSNNGSNLKKLESGSYFGSQNKVTHRLSTNSDLGCTVYIRSIGKYRVENEG